MLQKKQIPAAEGHRENKLIFPMAVTMSSTSEEVQFHFGTS